MNTIEDLMNHGIDRYTAERMLEDYKKRIGTMNGVYEIIDINYDFDERGRDATLQCSGCGKIIHRMMIQGRNKWSELIKISVVQISKSGTTLNVWNSMCEAERETGIPQGNITKCCQRKRNTAGGYIWRYKQ